MNRFIISLSLVFLLFGCKSKKVKPQVSSADIFPVSDYLKGQIASMDTSLASYFKIEMADGVSDTTSIKNSEVRHYANDFLTLPDITSKELKDDYEVTHLYDEELDAFAFTFTTKEDHPVKSEHVILDPQQNAEGKNDIKSIFVNLWQTKGDSSIRKNMLWDAGKSFQITTTTDVAGKNEKTKKLKVIWNGFDNQYR
jgi:viroplasmin and RNaseH domain-containing protein